MSLDTAEVEALTAAVERLRVEQADSAAGWRFAQETRNRAERAEAEVERLREAALSVLWVFEGNATVEERVAALRKLRSLLKENA